MKIVRLRLPSYDYKIFVIGPFQAGKTTFIHTLDPHSVSIERDMKRPHRGEKSTTTTAFDRGQVSWVRKTSTDLGLVMSKKKFTAEASEYSGWRVKSIELRGAPGQMHFKAIRETMMDGANGVIFVIDSSDQATIGDAMAILAEMEVRLGLIPLEIVANKQDLLDAASPEAVASWFGKGETFGMCAKDRISCKDALCKLLVRLDHMNTTSDEETINPCLEQKI